jgi:hypothetical protein
MLKDLIKIADKLDSLGFNKEADEIDSLITKVAKTSVKKPNNALIKQMADEVYNSVINNIEFAKSNKNPAESYKFWEGHMGLNIGWAKNRVAQAKKIILKSKDNDLSKKEKADLKKLIFEAIESASYTFPIPTTHHKEKDLKVFNKMNYQKACKCGETEDEEWYKKNCL